MLRWERKFIAAEAFESAAFVDVDRDGTLDIVSGGFWYHGPDFVQRSTITDVSRHGDYYDDFGSIALDVTGNGLPDLVTGGWWGEAVRWRENPGDSTSIWRERIIATTGPIEQPCAWDIDGDGVLEVVPNTPAGPLRVIKLRPASGDVQPTWQVTQIWDGQQGHGLGFGDISGSGRGDLVMNHGWLEALDDGSWSYHPEFDLGQTASVPILVVDVNGDGLADLIVGNGHGYGLDWWEQTRGADGTRGWIRHEIDASVSQCHTLRWIDVDGDGHPELITGKRWRAHPEGDPGNEDDLGIWMYRWTGSGFEKEVVDAGPPGVGLGIGIDFDLADTTGNGYLDIVAPGKDGLWILINHGPVEGDRPSHER